jgi:hypothetical protein
VLAARATQSQCSPPSPTQLVEVRAVVALCCLRKLTEASRLADAVPTLLLASLPGAPRFPGTEVPYSCYWRRLCSLAIAARRRAAQYIVETPATYVEKSATWFVVA